jgi:hypothetical protein
MPNDFKSHLPRVYRVKPKYYRGVSIPGNHPNQFVMGAEMPSISIRPKSDKQIIEVKEDKGWAPWIVGGLLGIGAGFLLANYSKSKKKKFSLKNF